MLQKGKAGALSHDGRPQPTVPSRPAGEQLKIRPRLDLIAMQTVVQFARWFRQVGGRKQMPHTRGPTHRCGVDGILGPNRGAGRRESKGLVTLPTPMGTQEGTIGAFPTLRDHIGMRHIRRQVLRGTAHTAMPHMRHNRVDRRRFLCTLERLDGVVRQGTATSADHVVRWDVINETTNRIVAPTTLAQRRCGVATFVFVRVAVQLDWIRRHMRPQRLDNFRAVLPHRRRFFRTNKLFGIFLPLRCAVTSPTEGQSIGAVFKHAFIGGSFAEQCTAHVLNALDDDWEDTVQGRRVVNAVEECADHDGECADRDWEGIRALH